MTDQKNITSSSRDLAYCLLFMLPAARGTVRVWPHFLPHRPPIPARPKTLSRQNLKRVVFDCPYFLEFSINTSGWKLLSLTRCYLISIQRVELCFGNNKHNLTESEYLPVRHTAQPPNDTRQKNTAMTGGLRVTIYTTKTAVFKREGTIKGEEVTCSKGRKRIQCSYMTGFGV